MELNFESGAKVEGVYVLLVQEMIYTCNLGEEDERQKKEVVVMGEAKMSDISNGKVSKGLEILIPKDLPVTGFPHCDFLDAAYFIHAVAKVN